VRIPIARIGLSAVASLALTVAFGYTTPPPAVASNHHLSVTRLLVPGKSMGPVYLGELRTNVHIGRSTTNGPGSVFYRDYSLTVGYKHGRAVGIATNILAVDPSALVSPGQYQTHTHPDVAVGVRMGHVSSRYPQAQCAHHVISVTPSLVTENCLLRSNHGHTFFAGRAVKQGQPIIIASILVTAPSAGPQSP
jgi:hypothetical protein